MARSLSKINTEVEKRRDKPLHIPLGNNLYLKIPKTKETAISQRKFRINNATYYFRYTFGQDRKTKTLGSYTDEVKEGFLTIGQAMDIAADFKRQLLNGHDPALRSQHKRNTSLSTTWQKNFWRIKN